MDIRMQKYIDISHKVKKKQQKNIMKLNKKFKKMNNILTIQLYMKNKIIKIIVLSNSKIQNK